MHVIMKRSQAKDGQRPPRKVRDVSKLSVSNGDFGYNILSPTRSNVKQLQMM